MEFLYGFIAKLMAPHTSPLVPSALITVSVGALLTVCLRLECLEMTVQRVELVLTQKQGQVRSL